MKDTSRVETEVSKVSSELPAAQQGEVEILDYHTLIERCMGNLDLASRLLERCQTHLPQEIEEIEKAVAQRDAEQVARMAHRLKGATATILAQGMKQAAEEIERCGLTGSLAEIPPSLERLHQEWERFKKYSESLLRPKDSA
jgi:HPt (histidine-containing phosphotransfer) domain-containing protein